MFENFPSGQHVKHLKVICADVGIKQIHQLNLSTYFKKSQYPHCHRYNVKNFCWLDFDSHLTDIDELILRLRSYEKEEHECHNARCSIGDAS